MTYVIRSMSTTDWNGRDPVVPYHVYLMPTHKRNGAWWTTSSMDVMLFPTIEDAEAEWFRLGLHLKGGRCDIAPLRYPVPVWDAIHHKPTGA